MLLRDYFQERMMATSSTCGEKARHILRGNLSQDIQVFSYRVGVYRIQVNPKGYPQNFANLLKSVELKMATHYKYVYIYLYICYQPSNAS